MYVQENIIIDGAANSPMGTIVPRCLNQVLHDFQRIKDEIDVIVIRVKVKSCMTFCDPVRVL